MVVDKVLRVTDIPETKLHMNAHTRVDHMNGDHWVVFATPELSGRFCRAIPIGEFRGKSYDAARRGDADSCNEAVYALYGLSRKERAALGGNGA